MKTVSKLIFFVLTFLALAASAYAADDSPLFEAVKKGDKAAVEALLARGADVNAKDKDIYGRTPLHWAVVLGMKDIAELLLAKGADVNARDANGDISLYGAALMENKDAAELLLTKGADVNAKGLYGMTPLNRLVSSARHQEMVAWLLAKGADVNTKDDYWDTPLHRAVRDKNRDMTELLLAQGADMNAKNYPRGETPLDIAALGGQKDIVELLKEHPVKQARFLEHIRSNPSAAFVELTARLKGNPANDNMRRLVLKLASELKPAPAIPEEARKHFIEGTAIVKSAKNPAQQALAAQSFTEALKVAPWWGDAYYNLGVAQELAEKYDEAEQAFNFYLLSNPRATEKREVQDRIYGLSAKRKLLGAK